MALAYQQPGVTVEEVVTPSVSPLIAAPALICLIGTAQGFSTRTDQFYINGTGAVPIPGLADTAELVEVLGVKDALNPQNGASDGSGYSEGSDYTIQLDNGTITRVNSGVIPDGALINVTYRFVSGDYFLPVRLYDLSTVEGRYGPGLTVDGLSINSPLSYAASIAFENGASSIVCQPLFVRETPGDPTTAQLQPADTDIPALSTWQDTLFTLRDIEDINLIVPVVGQALPHVGDSSMLTIFQAIQDHMYFMSQQDQYIISIFGEDSSLSTSVAQDAVIQVHAGILQSRYDGAMAEQTVVINTSKFSRALPASGTTFYLGAQYAATALAGMISSRPVSSSLTRKQLSGFVSVQDPRTLQQKNADAAAGLLVIESKQGAVLVRHAITLDQTSASRRELSVVRAKHRMIESVRDTLDRQVVGQIIADGNAPGIVTQTVVSVLEVLRQTRDLVDYSGVQSRLLSLDPTTIQVRFSYRPSFPLNYVDVQFSIDLTAAAVTVADSITGA